MSNLRNELTKMYKGFCEENNYDYISMDDLLTSGSITDNNHYEMVNDMMGLWNNLDDYKVKSYTPQNDKKLENRINLFLRVNGILGTVNFNVTDHTTSFTVLDSTNYFDGYTIVISSNDGHGIPEEMNYEIRLYKKNKFINSFKNNAILDYTYVNNADLFLQQNINILDTELMDLFEKQDYAEYHNFEITLNDKGYFDYIQFNDQSVVYFDQTDMFLKFADNVNPMYYALKESERKKDRELMKIELNKYLDKYSDDDYCIDTATLIGELIE